MELKIKLSDETVIKAGECALLHGTTVQDLEVAAENAIDRFLNETLKPTPSKAKRARKVKPADPNAPPKVKAPYGSNTIKKINALCEKLDLTIEEATTAARVQVVDDVADLTKNQKAALLAHLKTM